jgi:hypothetical protein
MFQGNSNQENNIIGRQSHVGSFEVNKLYHATKPERNTELKTEKAAQAASQLAQTPGASSETVGTFLSL